MRVWATRDKDGTQALWYECPTLELSAEWVGSALLAFDHGRINEKVIMDALFPRNIKPGECKMFNIPRLGTKGK